MNIKPYLLGLGLTTLIGIGTGCAPTRSTYYEYPLEHPVILTLSGISLTDYTVQDTPLHFQATKNDYRTGGYIFTTVTPHTLKDRSCVVAQTTANYQLQYLPDEFLYPGVPYPTDADALCQVFSSCVF
jgi:hypothetical protein